MADKKVTQLDALASLSGDDLFMVVDDPAGTPSNKKVTADGVFGNLGVTTIFQARASVGASGSFSLRNLTPASSDNTVTQYPTGSIWFDEFYMYVVVDQTDNGIKRIQLSEF